MGRLGLVSVYENVKKTLWSWMF